MRSGYSGTPLWKKLGLKAGLTFVVLNPPPDYWALIAPLPPDLIVSPEEASPLGCIHLFVTDQAQLAAQVAPLKARLAPDGMLWVSWPKRASGVQTNLTEDGIRALALANGLVDVKVCAVDATWSGLKLVIPLRERPPRQ
jgi:hypothetical protein